MTPYPENELCGSLANRGQHPFVWEKMFRPHYVLSMRPINLHNDDDLIVIGQWIQQGYAVTQPADQLRVVYTIIAECSYVQSLMIFLNRDHPICVIDVSEANWDEVVEYYDHHDGDFRFQLYPALPVLPAFTNLGPDVIQTCLDYFFSHAEVKRIVWTINDDDLYGIQAAVKTGFRLVTTLSEKGRSMNLYIKTFNA